MRRRSPTRSRPASDSSVERARADVRRIGLGCRLRPRRRPVRHGRARRPRGSVASCRARSERALDLLSIDPLQVLVHYALAELFLGAHLVTLQRRGATPDQAHQWWQYLQRADADGTLLVSFTAFVVVGAKR